MSTQLKQFDHCACLFASVLCCKGIFSEAETLNKYHTGRLGHHYINDSDDYEKLQYVKFQRYVIFTHICSDERIGSGIGNAVNVSMSCSKGICSGVQILNKYHTYMSSTPLVIKMTMKILGLFVLK